MEEKNQEVRELCAVPKETVTRRLDELVKNPASKAVLDEYFMWVAILNSPISVVDQSETQKVPE